MAKRVMIVDDSPLSRVMISKAVSSEGEFDIVAVDGGQEAIRVQQETPAEIIFLDLTMPEVTGFDVLEALKGNTAQIVVVTADRQKKTAEKIMALGAKSVISKPPDRNAIRAILAEVQNG